MNKKMMWFLMTLCAASTWAQSGFLNEMNAKRKQIGVPAAMALDAALSSACENVGTKTAGLGKSAADASTIQEYKKYLWNNHVYDIDVKVFYLEGKNTADALSKASQSNAEFAKVLADKDFNRVGVYEESSAGTTRTKVIATKRFVEFDKTFQGRISKHAGGRISHVLEVTGKSFIKDIGYKEGEFNNLEKPVINTGKKVSLNKDQSFTIPVKVPTDLQSSEIGGVVFYDGNNNPVAFIKF